MISGLIPKMHVPMSFGLILGYVVRRLVIIIIIIIIIIIPNGAKF